MSKVGKKRSSPPTWPTSKLKRQYYFKTSKLFYFCFTLSNKNKRSPFFCWVSSNHLPLKYPSSTRLDSSIRLYISRVLFSPPNPLNNVQSPTIFCCELVSFTLFSMVIMEEKMVVIRTQQKGPIIWCFSINVSYHWTLKSIGILALISISIIS